MSELIENGHLEYYKASDKESSLSTGVWLLNSNKKHAIKVFSDRDSLIESTDSQPNKSDPDALSSYPAENITRSISNFSSEVTDDLLFRTKITQVDGDVEKVDLSLDDHIMSILMDMSGSQSWNDQTGLRHTMAQRLVTRLASTYPGNVSFNLLSFAGDPINVTMFAILQSSDISGTNFQDINNSFFQDDESRFAGIRVLRKEGSYPTSPIDGDIVTEGFFEAILDIDLIEGTEYFYSIFTFDKNFHFSSGKNIKVTPRERVIPRGVASFSGQSLRGTGVVRDDNLIAAWHMDEGSKGRIYDFSDNKVNLLITDEKPVWLGTADVPSGLSGLRFNSITTYAQSESASQSLSIGSSENLTVMAWIYPYTITGTKAITGVQSASNTNYLLYQDTDKIGIKIGSSVLTSGSALTANEWNHVAVTVNMSTRAVEFFVNGFSVSSSTIAAYSLSGDDKYADIGYDRISSYDKFFGKITEVSIHNTIRSDSYISQFTTIDDSSDKSKPNPDNGDRIVVLEYNIPSDANYDSIRIVKNEFNAPSWEEDGDILFETTASSGSYIVTDSDNFVLGKEVNYRIFSYNSHNNYSILEDSPNISLDIDILPDEISGSLDTLSPSLSAPYSPTVKAGNKKAYIKWSNSTDERISRVEVYYKQDGYPIISDYKSTDGELVFEGSVSDKSFVHRDIPNNKSAFYTIVNRDKVGRVSESTNIDVIPLRSASEVGIPLLDIYNIRYEIVDNSSISVSWNNPIEFQRDLDGFFDEEVLIYAAISDRLGVPIADDTNILLQVDASFSTQKFNEDIFGGSSSGIDNFSESDFYSFTSRIVSPGVLKGSLRMTSSVDLLSLLQKADFSIKVKSTVPDLSTRRSDGTFGDNLFEFESSPISVLLINPFSVDLTNRDGRSIGKNCPIKCDGMSFSSLLAAEGACSEEKNMDGAYIRSDNPFYARVLLEYKDESIPAGIPVSIRVFDAAVDVCKPTSRPLRVSTTVLPLATTLSSVVKIQDIVDKDTGKTTGEKEIISFVDIPLSVPRFEQGAILYISVNYNGYHVSKDMTLYFNNILFIKNTVLAPISDGTDVAEQFAQAYLIDPDFPNDENKIKLLPDGTVIRWSLALGEFGVNRPFYSTDPTVPTSGVFSRINNGVSRGVFFGPASGVKWNTVISGGGILFIGERYTISTSVQYDGLSAKDNVPVEIFPLTYGFNSRFGFRFLMEFPEMKNVIWADGEDYVKLRISKDASSALTKYASCFRSCAISFGSDISSLIEGQGIILNTGIERTLSQDINDEDPTTVLESGAVNILWGDVEEGIDPYTGYRSISLGDNGKSAKDRAVIEIEDSDDTYVYFQINGFFPPPKGGCPSGDSPLGDDAVVNPCECLGATDKPLSPILCTEITVSGSTGLFLDGASRFARGGGGIKDGVPPTIIVPREPLEISFAGLKANGNPSNALVIDGETVNEIFVFVSFSGKNVPDGTPIRVDIESNITGGKSKIVPRSLIIYTRASTDDDIDDTISKSYASVTIDPINPEDEVFEIIRFTTTYDKSGEVDRERNVCVSVEYSTGNFDETDIPDIFSSRLDVFNTVSEDWDASLSPMSKPRGHMILETVDNNLYAIGGIDATTISKTNEKYSVDSDEWTLVSSMPTPRFGAMSVVNNDKIYVIGGITADPIAKTMDVSNSIEVYNPSLDEWDVLTSMPIIDNDTVDGRNYGVCFGIAQVISDKIYILCGVTEISNQGKLDKLNDRVLIYDINTDEWAVTSLFSGVDLDIYQRISPTSFYDGSSIYIVGGASILDRKSGDDQLSYPSDTFVFDIGTEDISINDGEFTSIPDPRYKSVSVSYNDNRYFIGGSNEQSQHLRLIEKIDTSIYPFEYTKLDNMPKSKTAASAAVALAGEYGDPSIFITGGFESGRKDGFLQMLTSISPSNMRLDGKSTVSLNIELKDDAGEYPDRDVNVSVRGFIKFLTASSISKPEEILGQQSDKGQGQSAELQEDSLSVYPVLFTRKIITISEGKGVATLLPRGEDILESIKLESIETIKDITDASIDLDTDIAKKLLLKIITGEIRESYQILVQVTINDSEFYGQTINDVSLFGDNKSSVNIKNSKKKNSSIKITGESDICDVVHSLNTSIVWSSFSKGITFENIDVLSSSIGGFDTAASTVFSLIPSALAQQSSPIVGCYSDIDWVPVAKKILYKNDASVESILSKLRNLENTVSFGGSPIFDAIYSVAGILSDNSVDDKSKSIYLLTDNESNLSILSKEEAIESVNSIDGKGLVPVIIGNFSIVEPITLSAKSNRSDTNGLDEISKKTGGQSITVLSELFINDLIDIFAGGATGSLGYGLFEFTVDIGDIALITGISAIFELFENTSGNWKVSFSKDGFSFTNVNDVYAANDIISFNNVEARYIKFSVVLITGFTASNDPEYETIPLPGSPSLQSVSISFNLSKESYLFLDIENTEAIPQQVVIATNDVNINGGNDIQIGVATSRTSNWIDFQSGNQKHISYNGKIFIPIRFSNDIDKFSDEPIIKIDRFSYKAKFGRWDPSSQVAIVDSSGDSISSDSYRVFPREGIVVFSSSQSKNLFIRINNGNNLRVGMRLINKSVSDPIEIDGIGFMYNSNINLLPPLDKIAPEADNIILTPDDPEVYSVFTSQYKFVDINGDEEDTDQTEIRWYINGARILFLDDLRTWNDISDFSDPLWRKVLTINTKDITENITAEMLARKAKQSIVKPGDKVYFTVRPSDGELFGNVFQSNITTVSEGSPTAENLKLVAISATGSTAKKFTANSSIVIQFSLLSDSSENKSKITWLVNGEEFKSGIFGEEKKIGNIIFKADRIIPGETNSVNTIPFIMGNEISVEISPETGGASGEVITSESVLIENAPPIVTNILLGPSRPRRSQNLVLTYSFSDADIVNGDSNQSDQSDIKWFRNNIEVKDLKDEKIVPSSFIKESERWFARIIPSDGLDSSDPVDSNTVIIL